LNPKITIKPGREKSILRHHPWIYSGAVAEVVGNPTSGETVTVISSRGDGLGFAAYSPDSQIRARLWTWDDKEAIDRTFFLHRITRALAFRQAFINPQSTNAIRLIHGESDLIPGLIVDRYADWLVVQFLASGVERWKEEILDILSELVPVQGIYERSDVEVRKLEGLPERTGLLRGQDMPDRIQIEENSLSFWVDVRAGQKTGFFLDQRDNRLRVRQFSKNKDVLDCFSYTGGFSLSALAGGANSVVAVDASPDALSILRDNLQLNKLPSGRVQCVEGNVFQILRQYRDAARDFDLIVLDPPKFAVTASQVEKAARGYKDINLLAFKLLRPGGILVTFSCSGGITPELFQKIVADAALDAECDVRIVMRLFQAADHPVGVNFPEGAYLKGLVVNKESGER
jgi:23S rRNA (cytosine1962-C5)-methyltransferase